MMINRKNTALLGIGVILIFISVWQIYTAQAGLQVVDLPSSNPPVTIIAPSSGETASRPTVLIAHGFAGSAVLMRGFALTLAHAGYTTVSWDFDGHGSNPHPFVLTFESFDLLKTAEAALSEAQASGLIAPQNVAILGHSMGSGVALDYGTTQPDTRATIAISPVAQSVTPALPHNLLLMAGSLEPQFVASADGLLAQAGGTNSDFAAGTARKLEVIPNVEHISILFSPTAQVAARSWLDQTFGHQPGAQAYTDRRILWFGLGILGFIFLSKAILASLPTRINQTTAQSSPWLRLLALLLGSLLATALLWLLSLMGVQISQMLGLVVGGYIMVWFGLAGLVSLVILRPHFTLPKSSDFIKGLVAFAALWLGVGLLGNFVWLPWLLIPARLWLWIPATIIVIPFFYAVGEVAKKAGTPGLIGWWAFQVLIVVAGFYLALTIIPELGFVFIILPLVPIMLGLQMLVISPRQSTWAYALSGAAFTSWLLLAVFPIL
jgi:pimeloyl-ACP methyl ester carboxylesterase